MFDVTVNKYRTAKDIAILIKKHIQDLLTQTWFKTRYGSESFRNQL